MLPRFSAAFFACAVALFTTGHAQLQDRGSGDAVRVTVAINEDGSRTAYEFDQANHKAIATTTDAAGKVLKKIRYVLDDGGRFSTGEVFGPKEQFRFKTVYKYDASGQLLQETQCTKEDVVTNKIVYAYDAMGKQTGYSVYDGAGRLLGNTTPRSQQTLPAPKKPR